MDDLKRQSNAPVVRVFEILLGVAPATMVATYSVFVLLKGLEELSQSDPTGLLSWELPARSGCGSRPFALVTSQVEHRRCSFGY